MINSTEAISRVGLMNLESGTVASIQTLLLLSLTAEIAVLASTMEHVLERIFADVLHLVKLAHYAALVAMALLIMILLFVLDMVHAHHKTIVFVHPHSLDLSAEAKFLALESTQLSHPFAVVMVLALVKILANVNQDTLAQIVVHLFALAVTPPIPWFAQDVVLALLLITALVLKDALVLLANLILVMVRTQVMLQFVVDMVRALLPTLVLAVMVMLVSIVNSLLALVRVLPMLLFALATVCVQALTIVLAITVIEAQIVQLLMLRSVALERLKMILLFVLDAVFVSPKILAIAQVNTKALLVRLASVMEFGPTTFVCAPEMVFVMVPAIVTMATPAVIASAPHAMVYPIIM
jgi:hypothetical protein